MKSSLSTTQKKAAVTARCASDMTASAAGAATRSVRTGSRTSERTWFAVL